MALALVATYTVKSVYRRGFCPSSSSTTLKVDTSSGPTSLPPITHDKRQLCWKKPEEADVPFARREENPPCVPQLRPIEDMWDIVKREVYMGGCSARSEKQLRLRIHRVVRSLDKEVPHKMMGTLPARVRRAARLGVNSAVH